MTRVTGVSVQQVQPDLYRVVGQLLCGHSFESAPLPYDETVNLASSIIERPLVNCTPCQTEVVDDELRRKQHFMD